MRATHRLLPAATALLIAGMLAAALVLTACDLPGAGQYTVIDLTAQAAALPTDTPEPSPTPQRTATPTPVPSPQSAPIGEWPGGAVLALSGTPDGERLAVAAAQTLYLYRDRTWIEVEGQTSPQVVDFAPNGASFLVGDSTGTVQVLDALTAGPLVRVQPHREAVRVLSFNPAGARFASGGADGVVAVYEVATAEETSRFSEAGAEVTGVAWAGGGLLAAGFQLDAGGGLLVMWDTITEAERFRLPLRAAVTTLAAGEDGRVAVGLADGTIALWDAETGYLRFLVTPLEAGAPGITGLAFGPEHTLAALTEDGALRLWQADDGSLQTLLGGPDAPTTAIDWPQGGPLLAAGEGVGPLAWTIYPVSAAAFSAPQATPPFSVLGPVELNGGFARILALRFNVDLPDRLTAGAANDRLYTWSLDEADTGSPPLSVRGVGGENTALALSPSAVFAAGALPDGTVNVFSVSDGLVASSIAFTLTDHSGPVNAIAFWPDMSQLVTASDDGMAIIWDAGSGTRLRVLEGHTGPITSLDIAPNAGLLITGSIDGTAIVWDAGTGQPVATLGGLDVFVERVAVAPAGDLAVTADGITGLIRVWDVQTRTVLHTLPGHAEGVGALAFSPDGSTLASGGRDGAVILWDARAGELRARLPVSGLEVSSVTFSADGVRLAAGLSNGLVTAWEISR